MAWTVTTGTAAGNTGSTGPTGSTLQTPAGTANDLYIVVIGVHGSTAMTTGPSGWTQLAGSPAGATGNAEVFAFYEYALGGAENVTFTLAAAVGWEAIVVRIQGAVTSGSPFDVTPAGQSNISTGVTISAITTVTDNALFFDLWDVNIASSSPVTLGTGATSETQVGGSNNAGGNGTRCGIIFDYQNITPPGSTGSRSYTSANASSGVIYGAIKPAAVSLPASGLVVLQAVKRAATR